jgi:predicted transcriptional regulator
MTTMSQMADLDLLSPIQKELIHALQKKGPMTRAEIVRELNKPRTTLYDNLMGLMARNIVKKYSRPTNSRGRPLVFFRIQEEY